MKKLLLTLGTVAAVAAPVAAVVACSNDNDTKADFNKLTDAQITALNIKLKAAGDKIVADDSTETSLTAKLIRVLKSEFDAIRDYPKNGVTLKMESGKTLVAQTEGTADTIVVFEYTDSGFGGEVSYSSSQDIFEKAIGTDTNSPTNALHVKFTEMDEILNTLK